MPDLRQQLELCFQGRVCLVGIGHIDGGDDALGMRLAQAVQRAMGQRVTFLTGLRASGTGAGLASPLHEPRVTKWPDPSSGWVRPHPDPLPQGEGETSGAGSAKRAFLSFDAVPWLFPLPGGEG